MLTEGERHEFLVMHIAYKLGAIDLCQEMVELLAQHGDQHPTLVSFGSVRLLKFKNVRGLTNALIEHGFMSCRVLLEFLGVGLNSDQTMLAAYRKHRPDTVTLLDFDRPLLTVAHVEDRLGNDATLIEGIVETIRAGHKGGAHLTKGGESLALTHLAAGCRGTRMLVDHYLYRAVGYAVPSTLGPLRES